MQRTLQESEKGGLIWGTTKNDESRPVPLPESACALLKEHKKTQVLPLHSRDKLIFTDDKGNPLNPKNLSKGFLNIAAKAGFANFSFHGLRHTWATLALESGIHPSVVQEVLGHSDISVTLNIYSHVTPNMNKEAANVVAQTICGAYFGYPVLECLMFTEFHVPFYRYFTSPKLVKNV